jgi:hypothetical protein
MMGPTGGFSEPICFVTVVRRRQVARRHVSAPMPSLCHSPPGGLFVLLGRLNLLLLLHQRRRAAGDTHLLVVESLHDGIEVNWRRPVCPLVQPLRYQDQ